MLPKKIITLLVSLAILTTCTKDIYSPNVCFAEDVLPIFISNCTMSGCHNQTNHSDGYDLTTYEGIMKGIKAKHPLTSEIYLTIRGNNPSMPQSPYPKLSIIDVNTIKTWIRAGAQNTSNCIGCDTTNYSYSGRVKPLLDTWCAGCHSSSNSGGGIDVSSYGGVVNSISGNKLMGSLNHTNGYSAMPQNGSKLQQCEIDAVQKWINFGFPNN
jgi:hypothetical protein